MYCQRCGALIIAPKKRSSCRRRKYCDTCKRQLIIIGRTNWSRTKWRL